jgi:hypothetical protein
MSKNYRTFPLRKGVNIEFWVKNYDNLSKVKLELKIFDLRLIE